MRYGFKCRDDNGCRDAAYCDGSGPKCPPSNNKANKTVCNDEFVCFMGVSLYPFLHTVCLFDIITDDDLTLSPSLSVSLDWYLSIGLYNKYTYRSAPDRFASLMAFSRVSAYRDPPIRPLKPVNCVASFRAMISLVCKLTFHFPCVEINNNDDITQVLICPTIKITGRPSSGIHRRTTCPRLTPRPARRATITTATATCSRGVAKSILPALWPPWDVFYSPTRASPL